jgi:hypothetical protein
MEVCIRVRPLLTWEGRDECVILDCKRNEVRIGNQSKQYSFDWVAPSDSTQEEVGHHSKLLFCFVLFCGFGMLRVFDFTCSNQKFDLHSGFPSHRSPAR